MDDLQIGGSRRAILWNNWFKHMEEMSKTGPNINEYCVDQINPDGFVDIPSVPGAACLNYLSHALLSTKKNLKPSSTDLLRIRQWLIFCHPNIFWIYFKKWECQILKKRQGIKYWSKRFDYESTRLLHLNLPGDLLKECLRDLRNTSPDEFKIISCKIEYQLKSNLNNLLRHREMLKISSELSDGTQYTDPSVSSVEHSMEYDMVCEKICSEWERLARQVSLQCLVIYASNIITDAKSNEKLLHT